MSTDDTDQVTPGPVPYAPDDVVCGPGEEQKKGSQGQVDRAFEGDVQPHGRWFHVGFHLTTVIVGTGVLGLPGAMAQLTWVPGMIVLSLAYVASYYTACLLGRMHLTKNDKESQGGRRLVTYYSVAEYTLGARNAMWFVTPFQYLVLVGTCIAYLIAASSNIQDIYTSHCKDCTSVRQMVWTSAVTVVELAFSFFPSLESIAGISILAAIASISYCIISIVLCFYLGQQPNIDYGMVPNDTATDVFNIFTGMSTIAFAFGVHMIIPEIQATLAPTPCPTREFTKGLSVSWVLVFFLYFCSAISGYWAFGSSVQSDILASISAVDSSSAVSTAVTVAEVLVVLHVVIAYQVLAMPVYAAMERLFSNRKYLRIPLRFSLIIFTWFIASMLPFFGDMMALFGAVGITPLTFILPCIMYMHYMGDDLTVAHKCTCYIISIIGVFAGVIGTISAIRQIVVDSSEYQLFS